MTSIQPIQRYYSKSRAKGTANRFPAIPHGSKVVRTPGKAVRACRVAECIQEMRELYSDDPINELLMERDDGLD